MVVLRIEVSTHRCGKVLYLVLYYDSVSLRSR